MAGTKFPMDKTLPKNMALLIKDRCERYADINLQAARGADGKFHYYTYAQVYESVIEFALGLQTLGVHRGSNVALISDNRREWLVSDYALVCLGAPDVPRGCDSMGNEIRFIISYADCETGIFENSRQLKKITEKEDEVPLLKTAILFDPLTDEEKKEFKSSRLNIVTFEEILEAGRKIYETDKSGKKAEIESEMEKNGKAVCIPTGLEAYCFTLHGMVSGYKILNDTSLNMSDVGLTVSRGRSVKECKCRSSVLLGLQ